MQELNTPPSTETSAPNDGSKAVREKAVIYCRVSDPKQRIQGHGLESQEIRCVDYAQRAGYEILRVFKDDTTGGIADRPRFIEMLAFIKAHKREKFVVIVDDLNRMSRSVQVHLGFREELKAIGARYESPTQQFGESADDRMVELMLVNVAEYQRLKNAEQTRNRMWGRLKNGYWVFQPPRGYRFETVEGHGKMLVRDEPAASIVAEALEGFASGRIGSQEEMRRFLDTHPGFPKGKSGKVNKQSMRRMLTTPLYAGYIKHEDWGIGLMKARHQPLISYETHQRIQEKLSGKPVFPLRKTVNEAFPLRGFVACNDCGKPYRGAFSRSRTGNRYGYYVCHTKGCPSYGKSVRREVMEDGFKLLLKRLRPSHELFLIASDMIQRLWDTHRASVKERQTQADKALKRIEDKIAALVDRTLKATQPALITAYEAEIAKLDSQRVLELERAERLKAEQGNRLPTFERAYRTAMRFLANPCSLWESQRIDARRLLLKLTFASQLRYCRKEGYRTPKTTIPFKTLAQLNAEKSSVVPLA